MSKRKKGVLSRVHGDPLLTDPLLSETPCTIPTTFALKKRQNDDFCIKMKNDDFCVKKIDFASRFPPRQLEASRLSKLM